MLVLANYPRLSERLHEIIGRDEIPDNICFFSPEIQADLCERFVGECGEEIVDDLLREDDFYAAAEEHIDGMLGQVKNGL